MSESRPEARPPRRASRPPTSASGGASYSRPAPWVFGLLIVLLLAIGTYLAFAKKLPFTGDGYQLAATFENAATLRSTSPVRIAGVNVGEVTGVESEGEAVKVTFTVDDEGQPIHSDAEVEIRPRLFLEGNWFLDVSPGSPSAPELESRRRHPDHPDVHRGSARRGPDRAAGAPAAGLQRLLEGYGTALTYQPTRPTTSARTRSVARRDSGRVAQRRLPLRRPCRPRHRDRQHGAARREPGRPRRLDPRPRRDLPQALRSPRRPRRADHQLQRLRRGAGDRVGEPLAHDRGAGADARGGPPSLLALNDALPALRALAIESRPAIQELPDTIAAADPWLNQARSLLDRDELGELAKLLRSAAPGLAETTVASKNLFKQQTLLARCASNVLIPTGDMVIDDTCEHRAAELQRVLLHGRQPQRRGPGLRRQRPLLPLPVRRWPAAGPGNRAQRHPRQRAQLLQRDRGPRRASSRCSPARCPPSASTSPASKTRSPASTGPPPPPAPPT